MLRYWQPAALSDELTADSLAGTLFGEEMILFRDGTWQPDADWPLPVRIRVSTWICGRVEPHGLRCMYQRLAI